MKLLTKSALAACAGASILAAVSKLNSERQRYQFITCNGSSTLAPVIAKIATDFTEKYKTWNAVNYHLPESDITIYVSSGGSHRGVNAVKRGIAGLGLVARPVGEAEQMHIGGYHEISIGTDALTIAVNPENPLYALKNNLTRSEIVAIFSGQYKTWNQIDATLPNDEILIVTRELSGGAHEVFQDKIMGSVPVDKDAVQAHSMNDLVAVLKENKNAIGYASFGVVGQNEGEVVAFDVEGITPTHITVADGSYLIHRPLLIIYSGTLNSIEQAFIDYIKSDAGRDTILHMGFIPSV